MKFLIYDCIYALDAFISVNTAFTCSISWCNSTVVEQTVLARLTRFLSVPIFHSIGACEFQLISRSYVSLFYEHVFLFDL